PATGGTKWFNRRMRRFGLRKHDTTPDAASQASYRLSIVELAGELQMISNAQLHIGIQCPTGFGSKWLVMLLSSITSETVCERVSGVLTPIKGDTTCNRRGTRGLTCGRLSSLENRKLFGERIQNPALQHKRRRVIQRNVVGRNDCWSPHP